MSTDPDVEPVVWGIVGFGFLEAITVLTLLFSAHFQDRWFLLVFVVPVFAAVVVWGGRRLRPGPLHAARGRHAHGD